MARGGKKGSGARGEAAGPLRVPPASPLEISAVGLVALVILCLGALAVFGSESRLAFLIYDDAYYYLGVARHLAAGGGSTFDGINPTNGYHPGWAWLLVPVMWVTSSPGASLRLAAALWFVLAAAAPVALWWALRRKGGGAAAVPAAALFGLQPFVALGLARPNGLETPLVALLLALFLGVYERLASLLGSDPASAAAATTKTADTTAAGQGNTKAGAPEDAAAEGSATGLAGLSPDLSRFLCWLGAGLLLGAVILARVDAGMLAVAAALLLVWSMLRGGLGRPAAMALGGLVLGAVVLAGPSLLWNQVKFGSPMPVSGRVVSLYGEAQRDELGGTFSAANLARRAGEGLERLPLRAARTAAGENALGRWLYQGGRAGAVLLLLAVAALVVTALRGRFRHERPAGDALLLLALYGVLHYGVYAAWLWTGGEARYRIYYFMPEMMLLAAALGAALGPPLARRLRSDDARTVATALLLCVLTFHLSRGVADTWLHYREPPGSVAEGHVYGWIDRNLPPDAVLAARDAGKLGFFSGRRVVNLDGLASSAVFLDALRHNTVAAFIAASPIEYLFFDRPLVEGFDPVRPWATPGAPRPSMASGAEETAAPPVSEQLPVTLARLALRPEISLREVPGAPDSWVVYQITRR